MIARCLNIGRCKMHVKCINDFYPRTGNKVKRSFIPEDKIRWEVSLPNYAPVSYTAKHISDGPSYADPEMSDPNFSPKWNEMDGNVNRKSHETTYEVVGGVPRNYCGRTGIVGRGCLGRWGPNHAADPVVTRWKLDCEGKVEKNDVTGKRILEFVGIERRDCREWAIPGGMVDPGEKVTATLQREFMEEALNSLEMTPAEKMEAQSRIRDLFSRGVEIYAGYVDDPRNTDNSWMETVAYNFHEEDSPGEGILSKLPLKAGDDARSVRWISLSGDLSLYASHKDILLRVARRHDAHW